MAQHHQWRLGAGVRLDGARLVDGPLDRSWTLNEASLLIVSGLLRGESLSDVTERYAAAFGIGAAEAQKDVADLLASLERQNLLETRGRAAAIHRKEAVAQVMRHPLFLALSGKLQDWMTWYFRLIYKVLGRDPGG